MPPAGGEHGFVYIEQQHAHKHQSPKFKGVVSCETPCRRESIGHAAGFLVFLNHAVAADEQKNGYAVASEV